MDEHDFTCECDNPFMNGFDPIDKDHNIIESSDYYKCRQCGMIAYMEDGKLSILGH